MKITIWSDFICPFCYIGTTHLEKALEDFESAEEVEIEYKSFQLEPGATYEADKTYREAMAERKGASTAQIEQMITQISDMASNTGLDFNFDEMKLTDTFPAHRVFQYAKEQGKGYDFFEKLYEAFFLNGELISDADVLKRVSRELDLDGEGVAEIIADEDKNYDQVVADINEASQLGAQGVPFFVFNEKYGVSGAQPVEIFSQILTQVDNDFADEEE